MTDSSSQAYFGRVAGKWDEMRSGYFTEELREAAFARACLQPDWVVADVGSGTGFVAVGLAPRVKEVTCIDHSPEMLEVARRNLAGFSNVSFRQADGADLPLPDGSTNAVFANMYLHHAPDPLATIREMARSLRPGGVLVITDMDKHDNEWQRREMADIWLGFEPTQLEGWFREAGLEKVSVGSAGQNCCAASELGCQARIGVFLAYGRKPE